MNIINEYKKVFITLITIISIILISLLFYFNNDIKVEDNNSISIVEETTKEKESGDLIFYVDIKGSVKKPGVYEVKEGTIINDVIKMAGGLKKGAVTSNINLSKKVASEMVIYIFNSKELKTTSIPILNTVDSKCTTEVIQVNNCNIKTTTSNTTNKTNSTNKTTTSISNDYNYIYDNSIDIPYEDNTNNGLININTASKEELMSLTGIGASKADSIIIYRSSNSFNKIEDIMNVSGIGQAAFDKIKDSITV